MPPPATAAPPATVPPSPATAPPIAIPQQQGHPKAASLKTVPLPFPELCAALFDELCAALFDGNAATGKSTCTISDSTAR
ncbi:hypothetical protein L2E82_50523 [Cichorium intybus]|nr:hypothetical protein L2E82_50523 [Cichorium intybus]